MSSEKRVIFLDSKSKNRFLGDEGEESGEKWLYMPTVDAPPKRKG